MLILFMPGCEWAKWQIMTKYVDNRQAPPQRRCWSRSCLGVSEQEREAVPPLLQPQSITGFVTKLVRIAIPIIIVFVMTQSFRGFKRYKVLEQIKMVLSNNKNRHILLDFFSSRFVVKVFVERLTERGRFHDYEWGFRTRSLAQIFTHNSQDA